MLRHSNNVRLMVFGAGGWLAATSGALALESAEMFMHAANTRGQKTISRAELDSFADKRFDLIGGSHAGDVTSLRLGGRMTPEEFKKAQTGKHADPTNLTRAEFKAYAEMLADAANHQLTEGFTPDGALNVDALRTEAGKELIRLLE